MTTIKAAITNPAIPMEEAPTKSSIPITKSITANMIIMRPENTLGATTKAMPKTNPMAHNAMPGTLETLIWPAIMIRDASAMNAPVIIRTMLREPLPPTAKRTPNTNRARLMTDWDGGFEGIQFEFLDGKTLDVIIADLIAADKEDQALNIVRQFAGFVRAKHLQDLDLIFSNILITPDGTWNITDYEWMSEDADPEFVIYRAIRYFLDEHDVATPKKILYSSEMPLIE